MKAFALLQQIGKSLMLPVSVLPAAGLLLGVGKAQFAILPVWLSDLMAAAGGAIFGGLPLLFALGVALGLTGNDGVSALAALVGYLVMVSTLGLMAGNQGLKLTEVMGIPSLDTGVFGGILVGAVAAWLFNRYYRIELPPYLGFFGGKRFVPIVTAFAALFLGVVLAYLWPPVQAWIRAVGDWAAGENPSAAVVLYGVVERLLVPFGLHHVWNAPFFFEMGSYVTPDGKVVHGDLTRFAAGDPTAGILAGGFLVKMFGLPAAAIAMWHCARPERRQEIKGIMASAALTSFLTGITEPIEFAFMFVAPALYALHAALVGLAFFTLQILGCHMGFSFSQGFIDFMIYFKLDTRPWVVLALGPLFGLAYYALFRLAIGYFNLKTPGREVGEANPASAVPSGGLAAQVVEALGGRDNLASLDACITRLRVGLADPSKASPEKLKALGASGVIRLGTGLQAIFGTRSENLKTEIAAYLGGPPTSPPAADPAPSEAPPDRAGAVALLAALGGRANLRQAEACALTRVRVVLRDAQALDEAALRAAGVHDLMRLDHGVVHLIVGEERAGALAAGLKDS